MKFLLAIDQGTTSSRALIYDENLCVLAGAQKEFTQHYPGPGLVEHDAEEIWGTVRGTIRQVLQQADLTPGDITCVGITNQRETAVLWDRRTGEPLHRALVWQDRRTADFLQELRAAGHEEFICQRTGLVLDPYFSASKFRWLIRQVPDGLARAAGGDLAVGTIDSWLLFKLTGGREHLTDVSNASRTMLMNLNSLEWDAGLLALFGMDRAVLPRIVPSSGKLAITDPAMFGAAVPVTGILGDQQAALFGQHCIRPGLAKCTYGTGCFLLAHLGTKPVASRNRLLTTVAWQIGDDPAEYALEGSVFMGGATIQWLRDGLGIIGTAPEVNELAAGVPDSGGVIFVPAFTGLGAPYWDSAATGLLLGLTRGTTSGHIARAALEGIAWQVADVVAAMNKDSGKRMRLLRVDGGACASDLLLQTQADFLGVPVERPANIESTALGAAMIAGLGAGVWPHAASLGAIRKAEHTFTPSLPASDKAARRKKWRQAVRRCRHWNA